jgi:hypothetical protein
MIITDREKILTLLRTTGKALAPGDIGRRMRPRLFALKVSQALCELELEGLVESRPSGSGFRYWASEKG